MYDCLDKLASHFLLLQTTSISIITAHNRVYLIKQAMESLDLKDWSECHEPSLFKQCLIASVTKCFLTCHLGKIHIESLLNKEEVYIPLDKGS